MTPGQIEAEVAKKVAALGLTAEEAQRRMVKHAHSAGLPGILMSRDREAE